MDFGDETPGSGNFRVVEPRPVFVKGRLVYLSSIIPNSANAVSKTVIVDAETNKLVALFDNDRDPQAEEKTLRYIQTGEVPDEAAAPTGSTGTGATATTPGTTTTPSSAGTGGSPSQTSTTPSGGGGVQGQIDDILRRQRQLVQDLQRLREAVRKKDSG